MMKCWLAIGRAGTSEMGGHAMHSLNEDMCSILFFAASCKGSRRVALTSH